MKKRNTIIIINDDFRLSSDGKVKEGGMSRNESIIKWLRENKSILQVKLDNGRIQNAVIMLVDLLKFRDDSIVIFYPTVGIPILKNGFLGRLCSKLYMFILRRTCNNNRVFLDICDMKYEQAIDLEIDSERLCSIKATEEKLFKLKCFYIFASDSMMQYAKKKYSIKSEQCSVLENGGNFIIREIPIKWHNEKIKAVYAGSLNKGRNIEKMINCLKGNNSVILYLCGVGGEWIGSNDNIIYLGALEEDEAHYVVSQCDVGLIPYDQDKLYYNIAYPTKLAFYITAGTPFLSTDVTEVRKVYDKYKVGYIGEIEDWGIIISSISRKAVEDQKERIELIKDEFTWDNKCKNSIYNRLD